jgi:hypothetical protein
MKPRRANVFGSFFKKNNYHYELVIVFFFQKNKQKALFRFAEASRHYLAILYKHMKPRRANVLGSFLKKRTTVDAN